MVSLPHVNTACLFSPVCRLGGKPYKVGDPALVRDHGCIVSTGARAELVFRKYVQDKQKGVRGAEARYQEAREGMGQNRQCELCRLLYVRMDALVVVPIAHALLLGVLRNLVDFMFRAVSCDQWPQHVVSAADRKKIAERADHIYLTADFGRNYKDIVDDRWGSHPLPKFQLSSVLC